MVLIWARPTSGTTCMSLLPRVIESEQHGRHPLENLSSPPPQAALHQFETIIIHSLFLDTPLDTLVLHLIIPISSAYIRYHYGVATSRAGSESVRILQ